MRSLKIRLYPTKEQEILFKKHIQSFIKKELNYLNLKVRNIANYLSIADMTHYILKMMWLI